MRKSIAIWMAIFVGIIAAAATFFVMNSVFDARLSGDEDSLSLEEFSTVEKYIDYYYLKDYDIRQVQYAGLKAMVSSLEDPYTAYYTPEEFASFMQSAEGEYFGVGMFIGTDAQTGMAVVEQVFDGSPADEAGMKAGDLILKIDDVDVSEKTLAEVSIMSTGDEGTPVTMIVRRGGDELTFSMVRRAIQMDMVTYKMLEDDIGYMQILQFGGNASMLFAEAMGEFAEQGAKGVVIDLRDNPGGYLDSVVETLDMLLPEGTLVYTEDKNGARDVISSDAAAIDLPVTLIVNGNTASAAEIFAGAVQDFEYGEVVGTTSYGKGLVQAVLPIQSTGAGIKITTSEYFTPDGRQIDENGITPDYFIELPENFYEDPSASADTQLSRAIEVLKKAIADLVA